MYKFKLAFLENKKEAKDANYWFEVSTAYIDELQKATTKSLMSYIKRSKDLGANARMSLYMTITLWFVIFIVFFILFYLLKELIKKEELRTLELNSALNEAEKALKLKAEFLSNMSHEIRTPMNSIIGFSELLESSNLDSNQQKNILYIKESSNNLLFLIDKILNVSKLKVSEMKEDKEFNNMFKDEFMNANIIVKHNKRGFMLSSNDK
jgi:signal transduction histidine kinase